MNQPANRPDSQPAPAPDRHPGEPDSDTGELNTQSGARLGQDQLNSSNLGRHGQQHNQGRQPDPAAQEADPARHTQKQRR